MNKRKSDDISIEEIGEDDIMEVEPPSMEARTVNLEQEREIDDVAEKIKENLKIHYLSHPEHDIKLPNDKIRIIDAMTPEELKLLQIHVRAQVASTLDKKFGSNLIKNVVNATPFVDTKQLQKDIDDDEEFQSAWRQFVSWSLEAFPVQYKMALHYLSHLSNNVYNPFGNGKRRRIESIEPPHPTQT